MKKWRFRESLITPDHDERICHNLKDKRAARRRRNSIRDVLERIDQSASAVAAFEQCSDWRPRERRIKIASSVFERTMKLTSS